MRLNLFEYIAYMNNLLAKVQEILHVIHSHLENFQKQKNDNGITLFNNNNEKIENYAIVKVTMDSSKKQITDELLPMSELLLERSSEKTVTDKTGLSQ